MVGMILYHQIYLHQSSHLPFLFSFYFFYTFPNSFINFDFFLYLPFFPFCTLPELILIYIASLNTSKFIIGYLTILPPHSSLQTKMGSADTYCVSQDPWTNLFEIFAQNYAISMFCVFMASKDDEKIWMFQNDEAHLNKQTRCKTPAYTSYSRVSLFVLFLLIFYHLSSSLVHTAENTYISPWTRNKSPLCLEIPSPYTSKMFLNKRRKKIRFDNYRMISFNYSSKVQRLHSEERTENKDHNFNTCLHLNPQFHTTQNLLFDPCHQMVSVSYTPEKMLLLCTCCFKATHKHPLPAGSISTEPLNLSLSAEYSQFMIELAQNHPALFLTKIKNFDAYAYGILIQNVWYSRKKCCVQSRIAEKIQSINFFYPFPSIYPLRKPRMLEYFAVNQYLWTFSFLGEIRHVQLQKTIELLEIKT
ncbi:hypothetical protein VP01_362g5 [Puccinia sorghi]|uniref:Uncharacterized protein n=1 Tax=Puccinia sorghi TaxID=27349 RepID=A0A0L6UUQ1_9BASI|nr:hypothetical protein VP01_362g5 [Puccinia sorghi]